MVERINLNPVNKLTTSDLQNEARKLVKEEMAKLKGKELSTKENEAALKVADAISRMVLLGEA
ncbi:MAG: hypothetical protein NT030_00175 [Candidatus Saganbacteria bacterium]|nr:hypothetical protein [Candidatus Saganbacteria bacterium]